MLELLEVNLTSLGHQVELLVPALKQTLDETKRTNIQAYLDKTAAQHTLCSEIYDMLLRAGLPSEGKIIQQDKKIIT